MSASELTDIELVGIDEHRARLLSLEKQYDDLEDHDVETDFGKVRVAVQGNPKKPAIMTYHDIGLNHITCFQNFFHFSDMTTMLQHFCVYHVNAIGQHEGADPLDQKHDIKAGYQYPTMDNLAETLKAVVDHFNLRTVVGFGVGAGSNILARFALLHPERVEGLTLINATAGTCGWVEWGYQKFNSWYLKGGHLTNFSEDYLLWHWFGRKTKGMNTDLVHVYRDNMKNINPINLAMFTSAYSSRTALHIQRPIDITKKNEYRMIRCPTMLITGDDGPMLDETIEMNSHMDLATCTFLKLADCGGMALEEVPHRVAEAFRLFLQGMGYVPFLSQSKIVAARALHKGIPTEPTNGHSNKDSPASMEKHPHMDLGAGEGQAATVEAGAM